MVRAPRIAVLGSVILALGICLACSPVDSAAPPLEPTPAIALQGQIVVEGLGACGHCHSLTGEPGTSLSGGRKMEGKFGEILGPNITLAKTGLGGATEGDIIRAFRFYRKANGELLAPGFHDGSEWMSDVELAGITTYIRSLPPVENEVPDRNINMLDRNTIGIFDSHPEVTGLVPQMPRAFRVEFGQYLVDNVAHCGSCHSRPEGIFSSMRYLQGGEEISFDGVTKVAPNITRDPEKGLGAWSDQDYMTFFQTGRTRDGRQVDNKFCPVKYYSVVSPQDLDLVIAYLRTVPAE
jgi:hypothetical protein